jgi:nucleotide-binding universal stress UspA family protein
VLVVGYDGSRESEAAVEYAARRAGSAGRIVVVHALAPPPALVGVVPVGRESRDHGAAVLDALLMEQGEALTATSFELEAPRAKPVDALLAAASEADADEVVRTFLCECGEPLCEATVDVTVALAAAGPVLAAHGPGG